MRVYRRLPGVGISVAVLCLGIFYSVNALGDIPFPDALDAAAVSETTISNINSQALVLGNGDINALLWERDGVLCMRVAKNDIWDARVDTSKDESLMKVDVPNNKWSGGSYPPSWRKPYPQPRCAAVVRIGASGSSAGIKSARLDLRRAVATVDTITVRALAGRNVFLVETDKDVLLETIKSDTLPDPEVGQSNGIKWLHMKMPGDQDYPGMEYALAVAGNGASKAVAVVTSVDTKDNVHDAAVRLARETADGDAAAIIKQHEESWARYWSASGVVLDDPDFQLWWYRMVYYLRCFSKPGVVPAGLFSGLAKDSPPWHGDYHHNYNAWQTYWTPLIINHPELSEPWVDYMNAMLPRLKWLAKTTYDCEGAFVGISSFPFEPDPAKCQSVNRRQIAIPPFGYTLGMAGMSAQVLWFSHLYRPDRKYLEEKVYPVVREAALFYCSFAEKCPRDESGKAKFGPSFSPEHGKFGVANVPFDIAYAKCMMKAAIASANELGRDSDLVTRLRRALDLLPEYPTAPDESGKPVVVDWTGCKFREIKEHNITVPVVPVFPAEQVSCFSPEPEKELFLNTIRQTRHRGCNSTVMMSVAKARFSMTEALEDLRKYYKPEVQPNGMFRWPKHGYYLSESVGIAAAISEFLLQSADRTLRVFPCWPKERDASFTSLRAQGGFLVTATQKAGKVVKLEITSTVGGKLRLIAPETGKIFECDTMAGEVVDALKLSAGTNGFVWPSEFPSDCPFEKSKTLAGIYFTGRHSDYHCGDTFYPSWASDGNLYSPWTDGKTDGVTSGSGDKLKRPATTGHAVMTGDDPLNLVIKNTSPPKEAWAKPYRGRYPCGSLVHNGIWYYGTYCLGPSAEPVHEGFKWNWPNLGPMPGFQISRDYGKTWEPSPLSPEKPLFPEPAKFLDPVKIGAPHFVDFGKNMEHSPDGKAYLLGMGAEENDPKPRPCLKPGAPGQAPEINAACTGNFAHANLSWISADQVYLTRVKPSPETINDVKAYEFYAGRDAEGKPVWTGDFSKIKPLIEWNNQMGCVTATYVPGLKKYLMCITDGWPTVAKMNSYVLEADEITGPWRMVTYMKDFGEQGYFLNFPSKFISADGKTLWLCYSANFSPGWNGVDLKVNPPGGRYGLCLHEVKLSGPDGAK